MARFTAEGLVSRTLAGYIELLNTRFRDALGDDVDVAPETPQGQLIGVWALLAAEFDEALIAVGNGFSVSRSIGVQLDDLGSLLGIARLQTAQSTVVVTLSGTVGTVIPADARARTTDGALFALAGAYQVEAGGTVTGMMRAMDSGPVGAAAGTLTDIVDLVPGWTAVINPTAASLGRLRETDTVFRARYQQTVTRNARGPTAAIQTGLLEVDGVTTATVRANATASDVTVQTRTIAAHGVYVIVDGGTDTAVAAAIARIKPLGTETSGEVTTQVPHSSGQFDTTIKFSRVTDVPLAVAIDTTVGPGFPADGFDQIMSRVAGWAAGSWRSGSGDFEIGGLAIGEALDTNRILSPILSVPGHQLASVAVTRSVGGASAGPVDLLERLTIAAADVTIT